MSRPPLPDVFGNYALRDFSEVVAPDSISWLPQTAGWRWLGAILLALLLHRLWKVLKHWYRNRYRREAIKRLYNLQQQAQPCEFLGELNRVLKITALVAYSREPVAKLSGDRWVEFLNQQCDQPPFDEGQASLLANAIYRQQDIDATSRRQLIESGRAWINQHRGRNHA